MLPSGGKLGRREGISININPSMTVWTVVSPCHCVTVWACNRVDARLLAVSSFDKTWLPRTTVLSVHGTYFTKQRFWGSEKKASHVEQYVPQRRVGVAFCQ